MNLKTTAALVGVGLILGLGTGVPSAKVFQGVKTVTKPVPVKIRNGETTQQMVASFGSPATVVTAPENVTLPVGCAIWVGKNNPATGKPIWAVIACKF